MISRVELRFIETIPGLRACYAHCAGSASSIQVHASGKKIFLIGLRVPDE